MDAVRFEKQLSTPTQEKLAAEAPLQITVNQMPFTVTMRTPGSDHELATGLLFTEGVIRRREDILTLTSAPNTVSATLEPHRFAAANLRQRNLMSAASCGVCGKTELCDLDMPVTAITSKLTLDPAQLGAMQTQMREAQNLFAETGGVHAAAAFDAAGKMLALFEDIGRHNAVDKTVGYLLAENLLPEAALLFVSGRVSYEIVTKTHRAGIPFLAAVSAVSDMAAEMCGRLGITLLGFCREDRATAYAHAERLQPDYKHARTA
ncbi:MAG: formate dehydrogenase accessory sulfurtransferase FdhD [Turneriella sp.]|nr:formate dehydrogenase accessory sulfurtransferase FdhD [Turneriella sp.]